MPYCRDCGKEYREGEPYCRDCGCGFEVSTGMLSRALAFLFGGVALLGVLVKLDYFTGAGFPIVSRLRETTNLCIGMALAVLAIRPSAGAFVGITTKIRYKFAVLLLIAVWIAVPYFFSSAGIMKGEGDALFRQRGYEEALNAYDAAIRIDQGDADAWLKRAGTLGMLGRYEESIMAYEVVIELEPENAQAFYFKGLALGTLGRYGEALEAFDRAIAIAPDFKEAWSDRGVTLDYLGRYEEAVYSFDRALEIAPDYEPALSSRNATLSRLE